MSQERLDHLGSSDAELVRRCLQGDNAGFDELVSNCQRQVYYFCYRMLGNADESADAAQESFIKAYHALSGFRQDAAFLPWVLKIASNTCIDRSRARSRRPKMAVEELADEGHSIPSDDPSPEDLILKNESDRIVREAVLRLPEKYRAALALFYFGGLSVKDISVALGRLESTVKSDLRVAREMLRRKLEGIVV